MRSILTLVAPVPHLLLLVADLKVLALLLKRNPVDILAFSKRATVYCVRVPQPPASLRPDWQTYLEVSLNL